MRFPRPISHADDTHLYFFGLESKDRYFKAYQVIYKYNDRCQLKPMSFKDTIFLGDHFVRLNNFDANRPHSLKNWKLKTRNIKASLYGQPDSYWLIGVEYVGIKYKNH